MSYSLIGINIFARHVEDLQRNITYLHECGTNLNEESDTRGEGRGAAGNKEKKIAAFDL